MIIVEVVLIESKNDWLVLKRLVIGWVVLRETTIDWLAMLLW